ncbi:MAG: hypothetical protein GY861_20175 [bacterium]|nr:hypothetical protein [bacterium]
MSLQLPTIRLNGRVARFLTTNKPGWATVVVDLTSYFTVDVSKLDPEVLYPFIKTILTGQEYFLKACPIVTLTGTFNDLQESVQDLISEEHRFNLIWVEK